MLKDSVLVKFRQKNRLESFSIAVANLFVLGYTVTKEFLIKLCLAKDKYSQLLRDREQTYKLICDTKSDSVHSLACRHLEEITKQIETMTDTDIKQTLREYKRVKRNIDKLMSAYHNKRLFGIRKPIQYNNYKLSNYCRHYNNSFITKYLNNSDTIIELQQKIKAIPQYLEEHKQLWLSYYNNKKNRFYYTMPFSIDNKLMCDSMSKKDIQLSLSSRGIITV